MKKLIIAMLILLCGMVTQAASINWSANVIQGSPSAEVAAGWVVQVYTSDVTFSYDDAKAGLITPWASGETVASGSTFRAKGTEAQANGTTVNYYAVVYDSSTVAGAQHYIVSDSVSITTSAGGASVNLAFGAMNGTTTANKFLNSTWEPVPEPTSGLLLLMGGALLALRRKQK